MGATQVSERIVLEEIMSEENMAGKPADEVDTKLQALSFAQSQMVLCTACYMMDDLKANCIERANQIGRTLLSGRDCS